MENKNPTEIKAQLERYKDLIKDYELHRSRIGPEKERLLEMNDFLFNLSPSYLHLQFGEETAEEIRGLVSIVNHDVIKLLLQN